MPANHYVIHKAKKVVEVIYASFHKHVSRIAKEALEETNFHSCEACELFTYNPLGSTASTVTCSKCGAVLTDKKSPLFYEPTITNEVVSSFFLDNFKLHCGAIFVLTYHNDVSRSENHYVCLLHTKDRYHYKMSHTSAFKFDDSGKLTLLVSPVDLRDTSSDPDIIFSNMMNTVYSSLKVYITK